MSSTSEIPTAPSYWIDSGGISLVQLWLVEHLTRTVSFSEEDNLKILYQWIIRPSSVQNGAMYGLDQWKRFKKTHGLQEISREQFECLRTLSR